MALYSFDHVEVPFGKRRRKNIEIERYEAVRASDETTALYSHPTEVGPVYSPYGKLTLH